MRKPVMLPAALFLAISLQGPGLLRAQIYQDPNQPLDARIADLISRMTLQEKATELYYAGSSNARLQIPYFGGWNQCSHGVSCSSRTTLFPISIAAAATWNPALITAEANAISDEARALNQMGASSPGHGQLGLIFRAPVINISRNPFWGRIQECYGEDPWLTGRIGVAFLQGLQGTDPRYIKIAATLKHFAVYNVEKGRTTNNALAPERWLHEYFLPHWKACAIEGRAQSIMAAYNLINGIHCAENTNLLTDILRDEWGYRGFVVSDLGGINNMITVDHIFPDAPHADAASLPAGCDYDDTEYSTGIVPAVTNALLSEAVVNEALTRLLAVPFRLGMFDPPATVPYSSINPAVVRSSNNIALALTVAQSSIVLLKNQNNFLPLNGASLSSVALIGPQASNFVTGNYYDGPVTGPVSPLQGFINRLPGGVQVHYAKGCGITTNGTAADTNAAVQAATNSQVVIMCLGTDLSVEAEGLDRTALELPGAQQSLLQTVYAANTNLVVLLINAGPLAIPWAATNAPAIIEAWFDGEQGGNAMADVVLGNVNPGGKLPYTVYPSSTVPGLPPQNDYNVSQGYTYMFFTNQALFPFGHGLSYTTFVYSNLIYSIQTNTPDNLLNLTVNVQNTGSRTGDEVVQVYVHDTVTNSLTASNGIQAIKKLVGFQRITLAPGQTQTLAFPVSVDQLSYYDAVVAHNFVVDSGNFNLMVGSSSADIRLNTNFTLSLPATILPGAPGGLTALAYTTNVALQWNMASRAASYNVKRAAAPGGPFTLLAGGLTNIAFTDSVPVLNATNYYLVTATNSAGESVPSIIASVFVATNILVPASPTGLTASNNNGQVTLAWNPVPTATGYVVSRSDRSVGPFVVLGGLSGTNFTDVITNSSLTYYYQVVATNSGGTSPPAAISVKLTQPPPLPWQEGDIGAVGLAGGSSINGANLTLQGAGATIFSTADAFHYVYLPLTNDGALVARVLDIMVTSDAGDGWEKSGVMFRETLATNAENCMAMMTSGEGAAFQYRTNTGGTTGRAQTTGLVCPYWIKLTRAGNVFTAYASPDGYTWAAVGTPQTAVMASNIYAGLALSSHNTALLNTSHLDSISVSVAGLNAPTGLTATILAGTNVQLNWTNNSSVATANAVERSPDGISQWSGIASALAASSTNYVDGGLSAGTNYYYRVRALNGAYASPYSQVAGARTVSPSPPTISYALGTGQLQFTWPPDHIGWRLQSQTNSANTGIGTNWVDVPGAALTNQANIAIGATNGSVFFRLVYP